MPEVLTGKESEFLPKLKDSPDLIMVYQHSWGVTKRGRLNHVLKTHGLSDCVSVALYHSDTGVAGLIHIDGSRFLRGKTQWEGPENDLSAMIKTMLKNGLRKDDFDKMSAYVTKTSHYNPHELSEIVKEILIKHGIVKIQILPEETLAMDANDGIVYELTHYNPSDRYYPGWNIDEFKTAKRTVDKRSL